MEDLINKINELKDKVKIVNKELIDSYQEGFLGKEVYSVTYSDGRKTRCEKLTKNGMEGNACSILPITKDGKVILIVETRPNTKQSVALELPAGMVDLDEDVSSAALRELEEETGYVSNNIKLLETHYQDQGCSSALISTFVAYDCVNSSKQNLDDNEMIECLEVSIDELKYLLKNNYISDGNSKIAIMTYLLNLL